jgi:hypothetical protein
VPLAQMPEAVEAGGAAGREEQRRDSGAQKPLNLNRVRV